MPSSKRAGPVRVVLDSGTALLWLSVSFVKDISLVLDVIGTNDEGGIWIDCDRILVGLRMDFTFDTTTMRLPIDAFITRPSPPATRGGRSACFLEVFPEPDPKENYILGHQFFAAVYMAFDLHRGEVSLARVKKGATKSKIIEITPGGVKDLHSSSITDPDDIAEIPSNTDDTGGSASTDLPIPELASQSTNEGEP